MGKFVVRPASKYKLNFKLTLYIREGVGAESNRKAAFYRG
jgi:hypothetical protein